MMVRLGNFLFRYRNGLFPLAYLLLFWKSPPIFSNYLLAGALGLPLAVAGQVIRAATIGLAYIVRGGRNRQVYAEGLVQEGIFAHCRNPLYWGNFLILCGLGIASNSLLFLVIGIPVFAVVYFAIISAEENYLRQKFGAEYDAYCARVHRFMPKLGGLTKTLRAMEFKWRRLLVSEYGSAYIWMAGMILLLMKGHWSHYRSGYSRPFVWTMTGLLVCLTLAYGCVRYLKKSGVIEAN